jgi:Mg/Co/Ni transporter MgtE
VAVLNDDECLTGIVTVDDAVDVITDEANEDIEKMSAVSPMDDTYLETHPWQMAKKCLPWIAVLLFLDTFSTMVVDQLQYQVRPLHDSDCLHPRFDGYRRQRRRADDRHHHPRTWR